ncbi:MAG TPA: MBL fold metallo-hydrolase [Candidatus Poseidoniales archaeon]|jgi:glyoxylase-like metal-dependent hydrolase (beta-lactamase superfamily II)/rhodanese-related sulfurtransferase|nr:MAG: rhodanese [Euryarchaeota archaeon]HIG03728.1 MBL fold metallo-hydrolase [Candidatus Poseidoniales archaeon]HIK78172.1 MBL fold metallo-hydrolase [Candidatus Poseidoniales archaeon]
MTIFTAHELYSAIEEKEDFLLLDVRNEEDHKRFSIEGPNEVMMMNIPYFDFIEEPEEMVAQVPDDKPVRVVCAKVGSSEFVANLLEGLGRENVSHLDGGIISWGNLLVSKRVNSESDDYEVWQFNRPGKASCSYGLVFGKEMFLFDPSRNVDYYLQFAESRGAIITHALETHLQADYISGSPKIVEMTGAVLVAHDGDYSEALHQYHSVTDGEEINFSTENGPVVSCVHSPGHTPGSMTYLIGEKYMISGDTIFIVSIGRPDLGKMAVEWAQMLYDTLHKRISVMPDDLIVLPGHYTDWEAEADSEYRIMNDFATVKAMNEEIYSIANIDDFVTYIQGNMRNQPEIYGQIRLVNFGKLTPCENEQNIMDLGKNECAASKHGGIENA